MTPEEKLEELNKIVDKYGISVAGKGNLRTYEDYLKLKEEEGFKYPKLEDELNSKKKEINFIFIKKKG